MLTVVGVLSLVVPVVAYVAFIHHYALDVVWSDQWSDVALLRHAHDGTLGLATLWAQHTSNRILVPNLVVLALGAATHLDTVTEAYLSAVLAVAAAALLILAHRRRMPDTPWLAYCPVVLLLLTVVGGNPYYGGTNTLWGFTLGLYVVLAALAGALWLLDRPALGAPVVAGAVALAVIGSFSATQGLLIWPAGLVLLWLRDRPGRVLVTWVAAGVATTALFFVHYDSAAGMSQPGYLASHPGASASFFLFSLGDNVLGRVLTAPPSGSGLTSDVLGLVVVALAVWVVVRFRRARRGHGVAAGCRPRGLRPALHRGGDRVPGLAGVLPGRALPDLRGPGVGGLLPRRARSSRLSPPATAWPATRRRAGPGPTAWSARSPCCWSPSWPSRWWSAPPGACATRPTTAATSSMRPTWPSTWTRWTTPRSTPPTAAGHRPGSARSTGSPGRSGSACSTPHWPAAWPGPGCSPGSSPP